MRRRRYPQFRMPGAVQAPPEPSADLSRKQTVIPSPAPSVSRPRYPPTRVTTTDRAPARRGQVLEGTIIRVDPLDPEPPDPNVARILSSLILTVDLVLVLGPLALLILAIFIGVAMLGAALRMMWITTIVGFVFQSVFFFLSPLITAILGRRGGQQHLEPVQNYLVRAGNRQAYTFRVKGRLQGATIAKGDRARVWGRPQHGILRFQGGENLDTGETLSLPFDWHRVLLVLVILGNIAAYLFLRGYL